VRDGEVHEIKSEDILQPGPAALTDGLKQLHGIQPADVAYPDCRPIPEVFEGSV
jgi:hypothetical protein